jgi:hypothetical protein
VFQSQGLKPITVASREGVVDNNGNAEVGYGAIVGIGRVVEPWGSGEEHAVLDPDDPRSCTMQASGQQAKRFQPNGSAVILDVFYSQSPFAKQREGGRGRSVTVQHPQRDALHDPLAGEVIRPRRAPSMP